MENYRLSSAMSINGTIRLAGTIVSKDECNHLDGEVLDNLIADDHLIPTNEPVTVSNAKRPGINRLLPRSRKGTTNVPTAPDDSSEQAS